MSITKESELIGMKKASEAVAYTLKEMRKGINFNVVNISSVHIGRDGKFVSEEKNNSQLNCYNACQKSHGGSLGPRQSRL